MRLTVATAAAHAGVSVRTLQRWIKAGHLPCRNGYVLVADVDRVPLLLAQRRMTRRESTALDLTTCR